MIHLTILKLQSTVFDGQVSSITLPATQGEVTILPNHLPIVTSIKKGVISATVGQGDDIAGEKKYFESNGGLLEFSDNKAAVLL